MAWSVWLLVCLVVLLAGIAAPLALRALFGLGLIAANVPAIRGGVLLRGRRAVRMLEWNEEGGVRLWLGAGKEPHPGALLPGSFRLGIAFLVLWFATPQGRRVVLIDGRIQDPVAFRRLSRHLARGMLIPSGPKV